MENIILSLRSIVKEFPGVKALDGIDLDLVEGEIHALLGENGAGKSTLIKILTGAHQRTSGTIQYREEEISNLTPEISKKLGISAIYQELTLFNDLPVYQNIFMGQEIKNRVSTNDKEMIFKTKEILEKLELNIDPLVLVSQLSIAEKQMVEIARAILFDARVLIMDEPTSSISKKETEVLFRIIRDLKKEGLTVIYISHRMEEIIEMCDRVTILRDGKSIRTIKISKSTNDKELVNIMIGKKLNEFYPDRDSKLGDVVLKVEGLKKNKDFGPIDFTLRKGEILGIGGLVGSKRSEIAESIFGLRGYDSGNVIYKNENVNFKTPIEAINKGFGMITEDRKNTGLFLEMSVKENITMALLKEYIRKFRIINNSKENESVDEFIDRLKIKTPSMNQAIKNLSGGNQQKALIARWLINMPNVLIMDEPTRGIDVKAKAEIYNLMCELTQNGVSIIMISSEIPELIAMSDNVIVMREGKISGKLGRNNINEENILKLSFGGSIDG